MPSDFTIRVLEAFDAAQKTLLPIVGSGLFWAWGFAWSLNGSVLPDGGQSAHDAYVSSMVAYVIAALVLFFRFRNGMRMHTKGGVIAVAVIVSAATLVEMLVPHIPCEVQLRSAIMVVLGLANGFGLLYLSIAWGARYVTSGSRAGVMVTASFLVAFSLNCVFTALPYPFAAVVVVLLPACSTLAWYVDASIRQERTKEVWPLEDSEGLGSTGEMLAGDASPSILPWRMISVLSMVSFLASFFGVLDGGAISEDPLVIAFSSAVLFCLLYLAMLLRRASRPGIKVAYLLLIPLTTLALLLVMLDGRATVISLGLLMGGAFLLHVVIWVQLARTSVQEGLAPLVAFGIGGILVTALQLLGRLSGWVAATSGLAAHDGTSAFALVSVLVLSISTALLLYGGDEKPAVSEFSASDAGEKDQDFDDDIECFAERHGLTEREREVFGYFVRGRNIPYVAEKLFVTSGTVKSHSNHIFQKTGVSSRQQLLDLFEGERKGRR